MAVCDFSTPTRSVSEGIVHASARPSLTRRVCNGISVREFPPRNGAKRRFIVASIEYSQVRKGMVIVGDGGQLFYVVDRDLNTPGNWRAQLKLKLKNLKTGAITENKVRPQDKVEQAYLEKRELQYIYQDGDGFVFMDIETFDQMTLSREWVGDLMLYMKENNKAHVVFYEGTPISLELPATVELKVVDTEPSMKGA